VNTFFQLAVIAPTATLINRRFAAQSTGECNIIVGLTGECNFFTFHEKPSLWTTEPM